MDASGRVLEFAARLVKPESRADEVRKFSAAVGVQAILLFILDREVGAFLSAPGFPQTLPSARRWREILASAGQGRGEVMVPWPQAEDLATAALISCEDYLLVIVGDPAEELMRAFEAALPLLGAALKGERAALAEAAQTKQANETARQAYDLALGLDKARRDAQRELVSRRAAEEQVRKRSALLEALNRTGAALAAELNMERIVGIVTEAGAKITRSEFGAFLCVAEQTSGVNFRPQGVIGPGPDAVTRFVTPPALETLRQRVKDGKARNPDILRDQLLDENGKVWKKGSFLAAPVVSPRGEFLGFLIFSHTQEGAFTTDAEEVIVGLASAAGIAIGNAKLYEALNRELDEHRRAEIELRKIRDELEQRVQDRTASLEQAIVQMEEFSYSVSHDLRAPLRAMTGYADALLSDYSAQLDDTARTYLDRIKRASMRMERLTFDLLAYSRLASAEVRNVLIHPAHIIQELVDHDHNLQQPAATVRIEGQLPAVLGQESAFGQVVTNLLTNAVKFVPEGRHPIVTITGETRGRFGRIYVADNGVGISPADQARLFRMFERLHPKKYYEGNGIGLAIVRKAVEKMGGQVGVESDGRSGTRFWFELPLPPGAS
jgi:signal transduction histidine kinase